MPGMVQVFRVCGQRHNRRAAQEIRKQTDKIAEKTKEVLNCIRASRPPGAFCADNGPARERTAGVEAGCGCCV